MYKEQKKKLYMNKKLRKVEQQLAIKLYNNAHSGTGIINQHHKNNRSSDMSSFGFGMKSHMDQK